MHFLLLLVYQVQKDLVLEDLELDPLRDLGLVSDQLLQIRPMPVETQFLIR